LATLSEIEEKWSIDELFDAHEVMDVMQVMKDDEQKDLDREIKKNKK